MTQPLQYWRPLRWALIGYLILAVILGIILSIDNTIPPSNLSLTHRVSFPLMVPLVIGIMLVSHRAMMLWCTIVLTILLIPLGGYWLYFRLSSSDDSDLTMLVILLTVNVVVLSAGTAYTLALTAWGWIRFIKEHQPGGTMPITFLPKNSKTFSEPADGISNV